MIYVCRDCSARSAKFLGRCPYCFEWATYQPARISDAEDTPQAPGTAPPVLLSSVAPGHSPRYATGIAGFDRVLGGGLARGAMTLIGGEPGAGKSTLLIQAAMAWARTISVLYVTGEETLSAMRARADRVGAMPSHLFAMAAADLDVILDAAIRYRPKVMVVDSVQTVYFGESYAGSSSTVMGATRKLLELVADSKLPVLLVAHVTKDGAIAGSRSMEHLVDVVLYLTVEDQKGTDLRVLTSWKNRHGPAFERAAFRMTKHGLVEMVQPLAEVES